VKDMRIALASGKGGTGKTTVAVNLAYYLAYSRQQVQYLDCDVEEPNGHIFLKPEIDAVRPAKVMMPIIDMKKCTSCGECSKNCQFHALAVLPGDTLIFPELCHSCGLCTRICPENAIEEGEREVGIVESGTGVLGIDFVHGILNVGEPMAVPLIREVKKHYKEDRIQIIDAPPGTSCPVVKTISDVDAVLLVTEPTPFGLHDLMIAVSVAKKLCKPIGVVINREMGGFDPLARYLSENKLPVLMTLPEDREIARRNAVGEMIFESLPAYRDNFMEFSSNVGKLIGLEGLRL
jgi:MinD superfamily P-loop ATPase